MRRFAIVSLALLFALPLACQKAGDDSGAGDMEQPIPTRADETARDAGEKPNEVMDELGIQAGSKVADVLAGGGYYTYWLSERVGADGIVFATSGDMVKRRLAEGDFAGTTNVKVVDNLWKVPAGTLDAVLLNRAYHLIPNPQKTFFPSLHAALRPGGKVAIVEVRLGNPKGHDMKTHRMGPETVREELEEAGFRLVKASELLANPDDPRTDFMEGKRHLADRMFLVFEKPEETAGRG